LDKEANYTGLVHDHNHSWASQFKVDKKKYHDMLDLELKELEKELNKLPVPKASDTSTVFIFLFIFKIRKFTNN
jgi:hypothetical protein